MRQSRKRIELSNWEPNFPPAHQVLGMTYAEKQEFVKAATELNRAAALSGSDSGDVASLAYVAAKSGRESEARKILAQLVKRSKQRYVPPYYFTRIYAGLGDDNRSFTWLDRAVEERSEWLRLIAVDPGIAPAALRCTLCAVLTARRSPSVAINFFECSRRGGVLTKNDCRANIQFCSPERIVGSTLACANWHSGRGTRVFHTAMVFPPTLCPGRYA